MGDGSICGLFSSRGIVGSSYINVFIGICAITYVFRKGLLYGVKF